MKKVLSLLLVFSFIFHISSVTIVTSVAESISFFECDFEDPSYVDGEAFLGGEGTGFSSVVVNDNRPLKEAQIVSVDGDKKLKISSVDATGSTVEPSGMNQISSTSFSPDEGKPVVVKFKITNHKAANDTGVSISYSRQEGGSASAWLVKFRDRKLHNYSNSYYYGFTEDATPEEEAAFNTIWSNDVEYDVMVIIKPEIKAGKANGEGYVMALYRDGERLFDNLVTKMGNNAITPYTIRLVVPTGTKALFDENGNITNDYSWTMFDDISVFTPDDAEAVSIYPSNGGEVPGDTTNQALFTYSTPIDDRSLSDASITLDNVAIEDAFLSEDKKTLIIPLTGIQNESEYLVEVSGLKDIYGQTVAAASSQFSTRGWTPNDIVDPIDVDSSPDTLMLGDDFEGYGNTDILPAYSALDYPNSPWASVITTSSDDYVPEEGESSPPYDDGYRMVKLVEEDGNHMIEISKLKGISTVNQLTTRPINISKPTVISYDFKMIRNNYQFQFSTRNSPYVQVASVYSRRIQDREESPLMDLGKWYNLKAVLIPNEDLTAVDIMYYLDDQYVPYIVENRTLNDAGTLNNIDFRIRMIPTTANHYNPAVQNEYERFVMDNFAIYEPAATGLVAVSPAFDEAGVSVKPDVIFTYSQLILPTSLDDAVVKLNNITLDPDDYTLSILPDGKSVKISLENLLQYETVYGLTLENITDAYGRLIGSKTTRFSTGIYNDDWEFSDLEESVDGNEFIFGVNALYLGEESGNVVLIAASYEADGALYDVAYDEKLLETGEDSDLTATIEKPENGKVKIMLLDSLGNIRPLRSAIEK